MRISSQQFLLEHAPKGKQFYQHDISESLQLCDEIFKRAILKSVRLLCNPHFPSTITDPSYQGWKWKSFIPGPLDSVTELKAPFPQFEGQRGCPGASDFPWGPFFGCLMRIWQHGSCSAKDPLIYLSSITWKPVGDIPWKETLALQ